MCRFNEIIYMYHYFIIIHKINCIHIIIKIENSFYYYYLEN